MLKNTMRNALDRLKSIKTQLELAEANIGYVNDAVGVASLIISRAGRIIEINLTAANMLGFKPQDLEGRMLSQLLDNGSNYPKASREISKWMRKPDKPQTFELRNKDEELVPVYMAVHRLSAHTGEISERMVLIWAEPETVEDDLTHSLRSQAELQQLTEKLIEVQEKERKQLAQELHDGTAQALTMIKFTLEEMSNALERGQLQHVEAKLNSTIAQVKEAIEDTRRISQELWPASLDNLGLLPTIGAHCRKFMDAHPGINLISDIFVREQDIPEALRVDIFRVLQECLRNIVQHARARTAHITLRMTTDELCLMVKDDGIGFDAQRLFYGHTGQMLGIGLRSMRERLENHQGQINVLSRSGAGTTITATWQLLLHQARPDASLPEEQQPAVAPAAQGSAKQSRRAARRSLRSAMVQWHQDELNEKDEHSKAA